MNGLKKWEKFVFVIACIILDLVSEIIIIILAIAISLNIVGHGGLVITRLGLLQVLGWGSFAMITRFTTAVFKNKI